LLTVGVHEPLDNALALALLGAALEYMANITTLPVRDHDDRIKEVVYRRCPGVLNAG
jgi:hypothetical protein